MSKNRKSQSARAKERRRRARQRIATEDVQPLDMEGDGIPEFIRKNMNRMDLAELMSKLIASKEQISSRTLAEPSGSTAKRIPAKARKRLEKWQNWIEEFRDRLNHLFSVEDINFGVQFELDCVQADGLIVGSYIVEDQRYRFFVNLNPESKEQAAGCQCIESLGKKPCIHTFTFADWFSEMAYQYDCELTDLITRGDFDKSKPDLSEITAFDASTVTAFLENKAPSPDSEKLNAVALTDASSLDDFANASTQRLCWDLNEVDFDLELTLRLQQPKKRGVGWTKGKRVSGSSLLAALEFAREHDRKIISRISDYALYYGRSLEFPVDTAIHDLIGKDNVSIEGKPATVRTFCVSLEFYQTEMVCGVRIQFPGPDNEERAFRIYRGQSLVLFNRDTGLILVAKGSPESNLAVESLARLPELPIEAAPQLIDHLKSFQSVVSIELPNESVVEAEAEKTSPVLLLRSREDGTLDFGIRMRGSRGHLYRPAEGPLLICQTPDSQEKTEKPKSKRKRQGKSQGKLDSLSLQRSPQKELQQARDVLEQLNLPGEEIEGSISDFETGIEFLESAQELESAKSIEVLWDKASVEPVRILGTLTPQNLRVSVGRSRDWLQLKGEARMQFGSLQLAELMKGLDESGPVSGDYIKFGNKGWAKVSRRLRRQLSKVSDSVHRDRKKLNFDATSIPALKEVLTENATLETSRQWDDCVARMEQARNLQPVVPSGLNAELRSYQEEGFCWLRRLAEWGVGGILADDMGLGKTLQALAVILDRINEGPVLIVAPTSVGFNWQSEGERFAPDLNFHLYRESDRNKLIENVKSGDVVICSYGLLLRDQETLASTQWSTMVLDEAQAIKNSRSKTSVAARAIPADWKLALTGTPMENHLGELWSIFHVVAPGVFGGWEHFRKRYALPIEKTNDESRRLALRERIKPFVLRRKKSEVLHDLPPRNEQNIVIELSPEERNIYDAARATALMETDQIAQLTDVKDQRFRLLALLTRLRQLACSPKMVDESFGKRSSKMVQLAETLKQLELEGHRVLVFSQFVKHLHLIRDMLSEEEISFEYLDGSTTAKARKESVERFQTGSASAFLISLKAGGTGLNLTAADYVIHMDPWWNPAIEDQATDRAHRIGQTKSVMCYRFVAKQTIEEEILKLHESKRDLVAGVLEGSATAAKLSTDDLMNLIRRRSNQETRR